MRNSPPPPGSSWSSEPQGPVGPDRSAYQHEQVWAWPSAANPGQEQHAPAWAWPPPAQPRRSPTGTASPPAGARYHRLARTRRYRWWVPPVAVIAAVLAIVAVQFFMGMAAAVIAVVNGIQDTGDDIFGAALPDLVFQLIVIATMAPIVIAIAWLIQRRPVGTLFSVTGRLRLRLLLWCVAVSLPAVAVSLAVLFGLQRLTVPSEPFFGEFNGGPDFALAVALIVLLVPFQASAEEIALRGFLMQSVGSLGAGAEEPRGASLLSRFLRTPVLAILISGTVFTVLHQYFGWGLVDVAVFGIGVAWLTWYTGGLEAALGLHVVHNMMAFTLSAYQGTLDRAGTGGGSWQGVLSTAAEVLVYAVAVVWLTRRLDVRRSVPAAAGAPVQWDKEQPVGSWRQEPTAQWAWETPADPAAGRDRQQPGPPPPYDESPATDSPWAAPGQHRGGPPPPPGSAPGAWGPYG